MPIRIIRAHKKKGGISVKSYKQKYKKDRGPVRGKKPRTLRRQQRTYWLMDSQGRFIGRADSQGETTARGVKASGKDYTGVITDKMGRIYGRYESGFGKKKYSKELKKAHPK